VGGDGAPLPPLLCDGHGWTMCLGSTAVQRYIYTLVGLGHLLAWVSDGTGPGRELVLKCVAIRQTAGRMSVSIRRPGPSCKWTDVDQLVSRRDYCRVMLTQNSTDKIVLLLMFTLTVWFVISYFLRRLMKFHPPGIDKSGCARVG
jgi:hypothetical protein